MITTEIIIQFRGRLLATLVESIWVSRGLISRFIKLKWHLILKITFFRPRDKITVCRFRINIQPRIPPNAPVIFKHQISKTCKFHKEVSPNISRRRHLLKVLLLILSVRPSSEHLICRLSKRVNWICLNRNPSHTTWIISMTTKYTRFKCFTSTSIMKSQSITSSLKKICGPK